MNLTSLKTFLTIAECKSLVRASKQLNISQSAVTARMQALEQDIGQPLFTRKKSGVTLTIAGVKLKRYAEAINDLWKQARQETSLPDGIKSICNIGIHYDLWSQTGLNLMQKLRNDHKDIAISAVAGKSEQLQEWLLTGLIDAALTYRSSSIKNQSIHELNTEKLQVYATEPNSALKFNPGYVYVDAGEEFGRQHAKTYSDADVARVSFGCAAWALDYLIECGGSAYLPQSMAEPYVKSGKLFLLKAGPAFIRKSYFITNDSANINWDILLKILKTNYKN